MIVGPSVGGVGLERESAGSGASRLSSRVQTPALAGAELSRGRRVNNAGAVSTLLLRGSYTQLY